MLVNIHHHHKLPALIINQGHWTLKDKPIHHKGVLAFVIKVDNHKLYPVTVQDINGIVNRVNFDQIDILCPEDIHYRAVLRYREAVGDILDHPTVLKHD